MARMARICETMGLSNYLHPDSLAERAVTRGVLAVAATLAAIVNFSFIHWCDRGVKWIEHSAIFVGPLLCFIAVVLIPKYRWAFVVVVLIMALWPLYHELVHW